MVASSDISGRCWRQKIKNILVQCRESESRRAEEKFSEEEHTAEIFRRDIRVSLILLGVGTIRANRFKMCRNSGNGNPKTECAVKNGPWGCLCDCGIRSCGGPRDGISEMAPCHPYVSPRAALWLQSWPWCQSPQPSCLAKGVPKKGERHLNLLHAGRCLQQGDCIGEPWSLPGKVVPAWHSSEHHRRWHCWQQTLRSTVLKLRVAVRIRLKPQGWLDRSSPAMQRCFHSITKYHSASSLLWKDFSPIFIVWIFFIFIYL